MIIAGTVWIVIAFLAAGLWGTQGFLVAWGAGVLIFGIVHSIRVWFWPRNFMEEGQAYWKSLGRFGNFDMKMVWFNRVVGPLIFLVGAVILWAMLKR